METGYVFLNLHPGMKKSALEKIRKVGDVTEVKLVIGTFDAAAKIEAETIEGIEKIYLNRIDNIP